MKRKILLYTTIAIASLVGNDAFAQSTHVRNDSIAANLKLNGLRSKRDKLQKEIKIQDAKRNIQTNGVALETLEEMNDIQDSVCLALRSELVDVILETRAASPAPSGPTCAAAPSQRAARPSRSSSPRTRT